MNSDFCNKYLYNTEKLQKQFIHKFKIIKIGLLIFLIVISIIYQAQIAINKKHKTEDTLANKYPLNSFFDSLITGFTASLSIIFVWLSRGRSFNLPISALAIVFIIMFIFTLAQEYSGFNRYMDRKHIIEGTSIYARMNNVSKEKAKMIEENGDPFLISCGYLLCIIIFLAVVYFIYKLFKYSFCAYKLMPQFNIGNIKVIFNTTRGNKYLLFALEILVMIIINLIPPMFISPYFRKDLEFNLKHQFSSYNITIISIILIVIFLHIMIQYIGLIN
jgi:hypothetical protein